MKSNIADARFPNLSDFPAIHGCPVAFGKIIGNQALVETPHGKIIRCARNLLLTPSSVCLGTSMSDTILDFNAHDDTANSNCEVLETN
jgi:hypothetical protein